MYEMYQAYFQQIWEMIRSYSGYLNEILTPAGCISLVGLFLVVLFLMKLTKSNKKIEQNDIPVRSAKPTQLMANLHVHSIAGDDVMTTQLDLARAYIEMGENALAKQILEQVIQDGDLGQQQQAQRLMSGL